MSITLNHVWRSGPGRPAVFKSLRAIFLTVLVVAATGCAQVKLGEPVPSMENVASAKKLAPANAAVGEFSLSPGKPSAIDRAVVIRSNTFYSPYSSSFALYLKENLALELRAAGVLNPAAPVRIDAWLLESDVDAGMQEGNATLAARFTVKKGESRIYERELRATAQWASTFIGAAAIPAAVNEYTLLYRKLISSLLEDPAFRSAIQN